MVSKRTIWIVVLLVGLSQSLPFDCSKRSLIDVESFSSNKSCIVDKNRIKCKTFQDIFIEKINLNNTCIRIYENQIIVIPINMTNIHNVSIFTSETKLTKITLDCKVNYDIIDNTNGIGFAVYNSENIDFYNIAVENCGLKHPIDIKCDGNPSFVVITAFYFKYVSNVTYKDVVITSSYGYSIYMIDTGSHLEFTNTIISHNFKVHFLNVTSRKQIVGFASGGGLQIRYNEKKYASNNVLLFNTVYFEGNVGEMKEHQINCYSYDYDFPFGRGGGLSISFMTDANNNKVTISKTSIFTSNTALWGGGVNIKFDENSHFNEVVIKESFVYNNTAANSGGGIFVSGLQNQHKNKFHIEKVVLHDNTAQVGGGLGLFNMNSKVLMYSSITSCSFFNNSALFGSAIFSRSISLNFTNNRIKWNNHEYSNVQSIAHGAMLAFSSTISVYGGASIITGNDNTGMLLDRSILNIFGNITFDDNTGSDGAGLALYGNSLIYLKKGANLNFSGNDALNRGGAMYVDIPGPFIQPLKVFELNRYKCFFAEHEGQATFVDNTAKYHQGSSIYASTIQYCNLNNTENLHHIITNWKTFTFTSSENNLPHIITSAKDILFFATDWNSSPGMYFSPYIKLTDERNSTVQQIIDLKIEKPFYEPVSSVSIVGNNNEFLVNKNNSINLAIEGNETSQFDVTVIVGSSEVMPQNISSIVMRHCPFGFIFEKTKCICDPNNYKRSISQCIGSNLYIFNQWWIPLNEPADQYNSFQCPTGYCKQSCEDDDTITGFECKLNRRRQCLENRNQSSILCSKCMKGLSVHIGSSKCIDCKGTNAYTYIWAPLLYILIFLLIDIILLYLNRNEYTNYLNSFIFFSKCVGTIFFTFKNIQPLPITLLVGDFSRTLFPVSEISNICLIDGLNNLNKLIVQFSMAFVYPFCILILYTLINYNLYPQCFYTFFTHDALLRTCNITALLFWYDTIYASISALHPVYINKTWRVFIYADVIYFSKEHLPYFVVSVFLLLLFVGYFILLVLSSTYFDKCMRRNYTWLTWLFNSFKTGLVIDSDDKRKDRSLYSVFYLVVYLCVALLSAFVVSSIRATLISVLFLSIIYLLLLIKPYESKYVNYYELFNMSILASVAMLTDSLEGLYCPNTKSEKTPWFSSCNVISFVIDVIIYLPLLGLVVYLIYCLPWIQKWIREKWQDGNRMEDNEDYFFPYRLLDNEEI